MEIVNQFFDANCVRRGESALVQKPPDIGIRSRIDVDTERGERRFQRGEELVFDDGGVRFGAESTLKLSETFGCPKSLACSTKATGGCSVTATSCPASGNFAIN